LGWEKKAENIVVLDVSALTQFTDYFVLMNGEVDQHVKAISQNIEDILKTEGVRPHHVEGRLNLQWVLIDYIDVVVHLFTPEMREFYDLEAFWTEAKRVALGFDQIEEAVA
jgi:ribosome-associated protein